MDALTAVVDELHFTHVGYRWLSMTARSAFRSTRTGCECTR